MIIPDDFNIKENGKGEKLITPSHKMMGSRWREWDQRWLRSLHIDANDHVVSCGLPKFLNLNEGVGRYCVDQNLVLQHASKELLATLKLDGCLHYSTKLNLWDGGTATIGSIVHGTHRPTLIGLDKDGNIVPSSIIAVANNGHKDNWMEIEIEDSIRGNGKFDRNVLVVTTNHGIFTDTGLIPAGNVAPGMFLTMFDKTPDQQAMHVIESSLLGDGCLTQLGNTASFQEGHKAEHRDFIEKIHFWLGDCAQIITSAVSGFGTNMVRTGSKHYSSLLELRNKWYPNGVKKIPGNLDWIDDYTIAKWYMDDGSLAHNETQKDRALFSTNCFDQNDTERLARLLRHRYQVNVTVYYSKGWNIRINTGKNEEITKFWKSIGPHIIPVMRYKIPKQYRDIPYANRSPGKEIYMPKKTTVIRSGECTTKYPRRSPTGYDIQTSTGNYFAKGVLVHNSLLIRFVQNGQVKWRTRGSFGTEIENAWELEAIIPQYPLLTNPSYQPDVSLLFEWTTPNNQIVIKYDRPSITLIGGVRYIRNVTWDLADFSLFAMDELEQISKETLVSLVQYFSIQTQKGVTDLIREIKASKEIEGFVLRLARQQEMVKVKAEHYLILHALKSNLTTNKLVELWTSWGQPDFSEFSKLFQEIYDYECWTWAFPVVALMFDGIRRVDGIIRHVRSFVNENKSLDRKSFAQLAQKRFNQIRLSLCFLLYDDKSIPPDLVKKLVLQNSKQKEMRNAKIYR